MKRLLPWWGMNITGKGRLFARDEGSMHESISISKVTQKMVFHREESTKLERSEYREVG